MNKIATSHPEKRADGWYIKALFGPFETDEEASQFALKLVLPEIDEAPFAVLTVTERETPPTLGINVSETIATKDKFG